MPRTRAKLLPPVLAELGLDAEIHGPGSATVRDGDLVFDVAQHLERHFLMRIEVAEFAVDVPLTGTPGTIRLGHRGGRRRTGITARARPGVDELDGIAGRLESSPEFRDAFLPLDSKLAILEIDPNKSRARIRHIGFSRVAMAFPPTQRYITAGQDQVAALIATMRCLSQFR